MNNLEKIMNQEEAILNAMPSIIEAFVSFYGESERKNIEEKFNNMIILTYNSIDSKSSFLFKAEEKVGMDLILEFLNKISKTEEEKETNRRIYFYGKDLHNYNLDPINIYIMYINGEKSIYNKKSVVDFLRNFNSNVNIDNVDELIESGVFSDLDYVIKEYKNIKEKYEKYLNETKEYRDYIKKCEQLEQEIKKKYFKLLITELKDIFTEEEYIKMMKKFDDKYYSASYVVNISGNTKNILETSFLLDSLIMSFSKTSEEQIKNNSWQKKNIIANRIQYFKNLGLDLGNDYSIYENSKEAQNLIPKQEIIERIINKRNELLKKSEKEYYESLPEYQKRVQKLKDSKIINYEEILDSDIEEIGTCIYPKVKKVNEYMISPVLHFSTIDEELMDHYLIHELNHILETSLVKVDGDTFYIKCGFENLIDIPNITEESERNYLKFNEIINELISQEINQIMFNSGVYIFSDKKTAKITGGTSYEHTRFIVNEFYQTYKTEIIKSRRDSDLSVLYDTVGKENFDELNSLFDIYEQNFSQFKNYVQLIEDLKEKKDTELTRIYYKIIEKRDLILDKMKNYKKINSI